ncbi:phage baseplate assembly protein V [Spartinivicinus marinus]|nr:phage baseplate assembly protein V [Spartinivicinus marinus]MCX4025168.1 phage baseplate assembly protein V [Spartinivicinus marinus]
MTTELFRVNELYRLLVNLIRPGTIHQVDHQRTRVRVQIDQLTTGWLPWLTTRAGHDQSWWAPEVGEQVIVLSPSGELANGFVLPAVCQNKHPTPSHDPDESVWQFKNHARFSYHRGNDELIIELTGAGNTKLISPEGIHFVGDLLVEGNITATQDITDHTRSMQADRDIYNGHGHDVPGHGTAIPTGNKQ